MPKVSEAYRAAKRQEILDAAMECFAREGFHRTSMQDIFAESGLSAGAVYRYFAGKDEIVEAIAVQRHAHEQELIGEALEADDLRTGMRQLVHAYFDWLRDPAEQRRRRLSVQLWAEALRDERIAGVLSLGEPFRSRFRPAIEAAQSRGTLADHVDPDAVARVMQAVVQGFVLQQAWEADIDIDAYVAVVDVLVDSGGFG